MADHGFRMIFSDIGGVLGTNGWDTKLRRDICSHFEVDHKEVDERHKLMFDSYERGYLTLDEYLLYVFFYTTRKFSLENLRIFALRASIPWRENIGFFRRVKTDNQLRLALISNEGQGITEHRIQAFGLRDLADYMVISHFTGFRKPDREIWKLALQLGGVTSAESIYIDDREMFTKVASDLGFTTIHHIDLDQTRKQLKNLGLSIKGEPDHAVIDSPS